MLPLVFARLAAADCMMPQAFFSAPAHAPARPTVFFFSPHDTEGTPRFSATDSTGTPVPLTAEPLGGALSAWQLTADAPAGVTLTFSAIFSEEAPSWAGGAPVTVRTGTDWMPPARTFTGTAVNAYVWSCDYQETLDLIVTGPAPVAWAVEWAGSEAAWHRGERQTVWLPGNLSGFYGGGSEGSRLELGHASCLGQTFDWRHPSIIARVVAVDADGTHRPLIDAPTRLQRP